MSARAASFATWTKPALNRVARPDWPDNNIIATDAGEPRFSFPCAPGFVRVEIQDAMGTPVPGFTLEDCPEVIGDEISRIVSWTHGADLARLAGQPVRLRIVLKDAVFFRSGSLMQEHTLLAAGRPSGEVISMDRIFNHDGFGLLAELAGTDCTLLDADRTLVAPLAADGFTAIDWCIGPTGIHNCRTRHGQVITRELLEQSHGDNPTMWGEAATQKIFPIGDVIERYNAQDKDLLDCVVAAGHARGLRVYGNVRLNHACLPRWLEGVPACLTPAASVRISATPRSTPT